MRNLSKSKKKVEFLLAKTTISVLMFRQLCYLKEKNNNLNFPEYLKNNNNKNNNLSEESFQKEILESITNYIDNENDFDNNSFRSKNIKKY